MTVDSNLKLVHFTWNILKDSLNQWNDDEIQLHYFTHIPVQFQN